MGIIILFSLQLISIMVTLYDPFLSYLVSFLLGFVSFAGDLMSFIRAPYRSIEEELFKGNTNTSLGTRPPKKSLSFS